MEEYKNESQSREQAIGTSRVNLSQRRVESVHYCQAEKYAEALRYEVDYRKRIGTILTDIHLSDEDNEDLMPEALMEAYWQGRDTISKTYWAEERGTRNIIWVRVDVRVVPRLETGELLAFFNNWDVTREKNLDRMMELIIEFDYDYVEYISTRTGHYEIMAKEGGAISPDGKGNDYDRDIAVYLSRVGVSDHLKEDIRGMQIPAILNYLEQEPLYMQEIDIRENDGSVRRKMLRYAYMDREMGTVIKSCTDIEDIVTEEKKKQEQLERALEAAEQANGAKSEFLAHMSHDIRTPMNAIIGMTAIAKNECRDEQILDYLVKIENSGNFLLGLINDILDISKIESGNLQLKSELMCLEEFDSAIDTNIRPLMEKKHLRFRYDMGRSVKCIYTDSVRFNQIFFNILSNAVKYTPEGGEVAFTAKSMGRKDNVEWMRFSVRDTGVGMSREFLQHAFEPFVQESNRSLPQQWQGTGLGLSIVKKLVGMMGGRIEIHSEVGVGTEVVIDLPLTVGEAEKKQEEHIPVGKLKDLSGRRVLLAEDNEINTFVARRILETQGIVVDHAENGKKAVEAMEKSPVDYYDAIIMDIRMPVMNGLEATMAIRKLNRSDAKRIPVIAMSANAYDEDMQKSLDAGMNAHLSKPIEPPVLLKTLREYII